MGVTAITRMLAGVALVVTLAVPFTPAIDRLAVRMAVTPRLEPADVIVVLAGGLQYGDRLTEASMRRTVTGIRLYRARLAPVLLFSGGATEAGGPTEAAVMAALARGLGVPDSDILLETASTNTWTEAVEVTRILKPRGLRRLLLVTDPFHMRRSRAVFERAGDFEVLPAPADPWETTALPPESRLAVTRRLSQELTGMMYYRARGWL
jgi:uncharacterized SAM-binding protein YcdF (DUF218 family)